LLVGSPGIRRRGWRTRSRLGAEAAKSIGAPDTFVKVNVQDITKIARCLLQPLGAVTSAFARFACFTEFCELRTRLRRNKLVRMTQLAFTATQIDLEHLQPLVLYDLHFNYHSAHHRWPQCPSCHLPLVHEQYLAGYVPLETSMLATVTAIRAGDRS
jgi:hypothetical protein